MINRIVDFVFKPIRQILPPGSKLIYTVPGEAFSVYVTIALIAGLVLASPWIMWQVWQLIAPALYLKEKKFAFWFILMTTVGFVGGAAFNHYIAFKMLMVFFAQFNSPNLAFLPRLDDVLDMYTRMLLVLGIVFQMPTLVFFLAKMGLVTARFLGQPVQVRDPRHLHHRRRRHAERRSLQPDDSGAADDRPLHHQHLHRVGFRSRCEKIHGRLRLAFPGSEPDARDAERRQFDAARASRATANGDDRGLAGIHVAGLCGDVCRRPQAPRDRHIAFVDESDHLHRRAGVLRDALACQTVSVAARLSVNVYELPLDVSRTHAAFQRDGRVRVRLLRQAPAATGPAEGQRRLV